MHLVWNGISLSKVIHKVCKRMTRCIEDALSEQLSFRKMCLNYYFHNRYHFQTNSLSEVLCWKWLIQQTSWLLLNAANNKSQRFNAEEKQSLRNLLICDLKGCFEFQINLVFCKQFQNGLQLRINMSATTKTD